MNGSPYVPCFIHSAMDVCAYHLFRLGPPQDQYQCSMFPYVLNAIDSWIHASQSETNLTMQRGIYFFSSSAPLIFYGRKREKQDDGGDGNDDDVQNAYENSAAFTWVSSVYFLAAPPSHDAVKEKSGDECVVGEWCVLQVV